jgi:hypothetical protein
VQPEAVTRVTIVATTLLVHTVPDQETGQPLSQVKHILHFNWQWYHIAKNNS